MITSQPCPDLPPPPVFAGEQDVGPSERGDMREQSGVAIQPGPLPCGDSLTEMLGVPVDDDGGEQIETSHAVVLPLGGTVVDFALAPDAQGVFQGVMGLALVQSDLGPALHVSVEEPFDDEEGPLDAADFAERDGQLVLAWIRAGKQHHFTIFEQGFENTSFYYGPSPSKHR